MRKTLSAPETARTLGVGLNYIYALLLSGKLPGERVDGRWRIPAGAVYERLAATAAKK